MSAVGEQLLMLMKKGDVSVSRGAGRSSWSGSPDAFLSACIAQ